MTLALGITVLIILIGLIIFLILLIAENDKTN
jgi:hypothetical protein